jgi:hypothetical protein
MRREAIIPPADHTSAATLRRPAPLAGVGTLARILSRSAPASGVKGKRSRSQPIRSERMFGSFRTRPSTELTKMNSGTIEKRTR